MSDVNLESDIYNILKRIGENRNRPGLVDTPIRVAKMYEEIFRGYNEQPPKLTIFPNGQDGVHYDEMITDTGYFYSMCEHHMLPFFGHYYFSYVPNKKILGISKIARVVDHFSSKLQIQERLTEEIVNYIEKEVQPKGVVLVLKARHLCKELRGVKKFDSSMTTSVIRGVFKKPEVRMEFFELLKLE